MGRANILKGLEPRTIVLTGGDIKINDPEQLNNEKDKTNRDLGGVVHKSFDLDSAGGGLKEIEDLIDQK